MKCNFTDKIFWTDLINNNLYQPIPTERIEAVLIRVSFLSFLDFKALPLRNMRLKVNVIN